MNHTNSRRAFTTFFYIDETSVPDADSFKKKKNQISTRLSEACQDTACRQTSAYGAESNLISYSQKFLVPTAKRKKEKTYTQKDKKKGEISALKDTSKIIYNMANTTAML